MTTPIKTRKLGKTGIELGEIAMGTWGLCAESYGRVFPEQRERTLVRAIEQGISVFDMAPTWGEDGLSEREVAQAVGTRRDEMIYITRAGLKQTELGPDGVFTEEQLIADCEASLKRLNTDHIDVWLLHAPMEADLRRDEPRAAAEKLKQSGKIRAWGASVHHHDTAQAALDAGAEVLCLPFNLFRQHLLRDIAHQVSAQGVGVLAHSVLHYGALAGRWSIKKRFLQDDHRTQRWTPDALAQRVEQVNELRYLVQNPILSMASAALRFVLAHDVVSCAILGPRTPGQVEAAVQSLVGEPYMPEELLARARQRSD